jgi:hypothetical protein
MKITELINNLQVLANVNPNLECVASIDSEGNGFHPVYYTPTIGKMTDGEFETNDSTEGDRIKKSDILEATHVCVN